MLTWYPDFCPPGGACAIEIEPDWSSAKRFIRRCPYHDNLILSVVVPNEQALFSAILQTCRKKEAARWAVKVDLELDKEHPGPPFTVGADGIITVLSGANGLARARAIAAANIAMASVPAPVGTSLVTVA